MYEIDGLTLTKTDTSYLISDGIRIFEIDAITLEVDPNWFCSYEAIKRILQIVKADKSV